LIARKAAISNDLNGESLPWETIDLLSVSDHWDASECTVVVGSREHTGDHDPMEVLSSVTTMPGLFCWLGSVIVFA